MVLVNFWVEGFSVKPLLSFEISWPWRWAVIFKKSAHEEIVQENAQAKADIGHICRVFTWNEHDRCQLLCWLHCKFVQMKFVETGFLIACCSSVDIIVFVSVFFLLLLYHFRSFQYKLTLQWCETLALKIEYTSQRGSHLETILVRVDSDWYTKIYRSFFLNDRRGYSKNMNVISLGSGNFFFASKTLSPPPPFPHPLLLRLN